MNFEQYMQEKNPIVEQFQVGQTFVVASLQFDSVFVEKDKKTDRVIFVGPAGNKVSSLGQVVISQAKFLEAYFNHSPNPQPVELLLRKDEQAKRPYFYLTTKLGQRIPNAE